MAQDTSYKTIGGRVSKEPQYKEISTGAVLCRFGLAANISFTNDEPTWIDCVAWEGVATDICERIKKGDAMLVCGKVKSREYNGKTYYDLTVQEWAFIPKH